MMVKVLPKNTYDHDPSRYIYVYIHIVAVRMGTPNPIAWSYGGFLSHVGTLKSSIWDWDFPWNNSTSYGGTPMTIWKPPLICPVWTMKLAMKKNSPDEVSQAIQMSRNSADLFDSPQASRSSLKWTTCWNVLARSPGVFCRIQIWMGWNTKKVVTLW